ncbi:hypothetical protein [Sulfoacidibacillus thermotolerans]|uniref:Uncharacterized protein n=1 Tax=Sulfoacidibacillus thermotolerans TaxID=1765684 RepID=A0A2U3D3K9_SULT2|nr:hypothetical protein [Sulfoacidibacillus thermotolerans]PWI55849.1 hypothetical protein BM613_13270 [Sulfoacidibacillus thermotolerans]
MSVSERSQALNFTKVKAELSFSDDFMGIDQRKIRSLSELKNVLNEIDLEERDVTLTFHCETEDQHVAHLRFYSNPKKDSSWYWGYVQFALNKIDSASERLLKQIRDILS